MRREAGMTLVEVMISAVVLSMVMLVLQHPCGPCHHLPQLSDPPIARHGSGSDLLFKHVLPSLFATSGCVTCFGMKSVGWHPSIVWRGGRLDVAAP